MSDTLQPSCERQRHLWKNLVWSLVSSHTHTHNQFPEREPDWPGRSRTLQYIRRHRSSLRKPRWHLQTNREGYLANRLSCLSRHSDAACSPSGLTAASPAHSSTPRYSASHWGSVEHMRWASTQSRADGGKGNIGAEFGNTPERRQKRH